MKLVIVTEHPMTQAMRYRFWALIEAEGFLQEDCEVIPFLQENPRGANGAIPKAQYHEALVTFRERLFCSKGKVLILLGGTSFKAVMARKEWKTQNLTGYVLEPGDARPVGIRQPVQMGVYKRDGKNGKKGDPKYKNQLVASPPVFPQECQWIVPGITVEFAMKMQLKNISQFRRPFKVARQLLEGERPVNADFKYTEGTPKLVEFWDEFVAYDLESPIGSTAIEQASVASSAGTWTFGWDQESCKFMAGLFGLSYIVGVAHNAKYDIPLLEHHGVKMESTTFDTMLAAVLLEPDLLKNLEFVAPLYLLVRPWKYISKTRGFADPYYNAMDSFVELKLAQAMNTELGLQGMKPLFNTMMGALPTLMDMEAKGMRLDSDACGKWCVKLEKDLGSLRTKWVKAVGNVNTESPKQLADLFYGTWKLKALRRPGDGIRTDEWAVQRLKRDNPKYAETLGVLQKIKKGEKELSTFGRALLGHNYVYPSYLPADKNTTDEKGKGIAATGRLACRKPNPQQMPPSAKKLFIPDRDDMCFVEADWSQAELRVGAYLSDDKAMQTALEGDIHGYVQKKLGCDRTRAKNVVFGSAYGGGPGKLREELEGAGFIVTLKECRELQDGLAKTFPVWWAWRLHIKSLALNQQYLRNPFGRLRRFTSNQHANSAMNFLPQSTVADMAWQTYARVHEVAGEMGGRLTTAVHDSFLVQVDASEVDTMKAFMLEYLQREFPEMPGFTCPADVKIGKPGASWADLEA